MERNQIAVANYGCGTNEVYGGNFYQAPQRFSCTFQSLEEANAWLLSQRGIEVYGVETETRGAGLKIRRVRVEYSVTNNDFSSLYQLAEEKKTRFFFGSNQRKFEKKWREKNPGRDLITSIKKSWAFRMIGGSVGYFKFIKEKYVVLYAAN